MKTCTKCKIEKSLEEYNKDGPRLAARCKTCAKAYKKKHYQANKVEINAKHKVNYEVNKEERLAYRRDYYQANREKLITDSSAYYEANREERLVKNKVRYQANKVEIAVSQKAYSQQPRVKANRLAYNRIYVKANKEKVAGYKKTYLIEKSKNPVFLMTLRLRTLVCASLKNSGYSKNSKTQKLLGADFETVWKHLEETWFENYGVPLRDSDDFHIDHISACSWSDTLEELESLQHYKNLQLLTPDDNLSKSDKIGFETEYQKNINHLLGA